MEYIWLCNLFLTNFIFFINQELNKLNMVLEELVFLQN